MRQRLGITVLFALLATLLVATPAKAVDTTPPPVGSCHDLTIEEAYAAADPDPAVDCSTRHTTITIKIVKFRKKVWRNTARVQRKVVKKCTRSMINFFDGYSKRVQRSAFGIYWFYPTANQRRAGARWVRCDLAIIRPGRMQQLDTTNPPRLRSLPLSDIYAKCRKGKKKDFHLTPCDTRHRFEATHSPRYKRDTYPGWRKMKKMAERKCSRKLGWALGYYEWPSRLTWKAGYRHAVCLRRTR